MAKSCHECEVLNVFEVNSANDNGDTMNGKIFESVENNLLQLFTAIGGVEILAPLLSPAEIHLMSIRLIACQQRICNVVETAAKGIK